MEIFDIERARENANRFKVDLKHLIDDINLWIEQLSKGGKKYVHVTLSTKSEEILNTIKQLYEEAGYTMEFFPNKNSTTVKVSWG